MMGQSERWDNYANEDDWYEPGSKRTTDAARRTAENFQLVPLQDGGCQIEAHAGGCDVEIEIADDGRIVAVLWGQFGGSQ